MALAAGLFASLGFGAPAAAQDGEKYFDDWVATCLPNGYCAAATHANAAPDDGTAGRYILQIGRQAQQTYWEVSFTPAAANAHPARGFVAEVGESDLSFSFPAEIAPYGSMHNYYFLGKGAQSLLDQLVHGTTAKIRFTDTAGTAREATFSLAGIGAALIWIDGLQGRIGSERVAEAPPYGLFRADVLGAAWMEPALVFFQ